MIDVPIHQAVSVSTEVDVPIWIYGKKPVLRQTGRHAVQRITPQAQFPTRDDGRYSMLLLGITPKESAALVEFLEEKGFGGEIMEKFKDPASRKGSEFIRCLNRRAGRMHGRLRRRGDLDRSFAQENLLGRDPAAGGESRATSIGGCARPSPRSSIRSWARPSPMSARRRWPNNVPGAPDRARPWWASIIEEIYRDVAGLGAGANQ